MDRKTTTPKASDTRKPSNAKPGTTPGPVGTDPQGRGSTGTGR